ncbi:MFS transporter [Mesorhizobium sp. ANAO-SY3R2]|uniref:MFS transporter n=1 Tax=Mesorhizobium sp. ANAO-SY3R2 TaxID=3166644 RepID=UPI00366AD8F8
MSELSFSGAGGAPAGGWRDLFRGANLIRSLALSGGVALHAVNLYVSTTILPSVVADIGGMNYYAWNTTIFVLASILGAAVSARLLSEAGARAGYTVAAMVFACGAVVCAASPSMSVMLFGRFVQGLGGGLLLALPYAMIRSVFAEPLWPRAMALLSSMWGIATLLGPLIGGIFAEFGIWRAAFWALVPATGLFACAAAFVLPGHVASSSRASRLPARQLALLVAAVLAASAASVATELVWNAAGLVAAAALIALLIRVEARARQRLLPSGTFRLSAPLGALYAISALLAVTVTCTEIFVPLFLQILHGQSPLKAGYIAALMSGGWTAAAIMSSSLGQSSQMRLVRLAPRMSLVAMLSLALVMPVAEHRVGFVAICLALVFGGAGVGLAYPWLAASILRVAPRDEEDVAATSIMTVQLCATAFGAALAGLTANLAGITGPGGAADMAGAARWLFITFALAPMLSLTLLDRIKGV